MTAKTVLITGASSGLGRSCAEHLSARGHRVYGTSRTAQFPALDTETKPLNMIPLDVTDDDSVAAALTYVLSRESALDVLINNAGYGLAGAIEDTSTTEAMDQFDTNFFGVHRMCRAAIPLMRKRGSGQIINVGSMGGEVALPFQSFYSASKAALQIYSQGLRMELAPFNIEVVNVEPGDFKTEFTDARRFAVADDDRSIHHERCRRAVAVMEEDERNGADPVVFAQLVERIIEDKANRSRYRTGWLTQRVLVGLVPFLPNSITEHVVSKLYRTTDGNP